MNRKSTIAENCRAILRERCFNQQTYPSNTWKPCPSIPTNPIYSLYGVDNIQMSNISHENPLPGLSSNVRRPANCIERNTAPIQSENCIQMITNGILNKVRYKIPQQEVALLCCCLPSLIRQIMSKCPWLTPNAIIQCLSADIIKEAMNCLEELNLNINNKIPQSKQEDDENKFEDRVSITSPEDDDSLSSYQSTTSRQSSKSILDLPKNNIQKKSSKTKMKKQRTKQPKKTRSKSRTPSTRSFASQQSKDHRTPSMQSLVSQRSEARTPSTRSIAKQKSKHHTPSARSIARQPSKERTPSAHSITKQQSKDRTVDSQRSLTPSTKSMKSKSKKSELNPSINIEDDEISIASPYQDSHLSLNTINSDDDFDQKTIDITPKLESVNQLPRIPIEYPGKKDPNAHADLQKCLEFYDEIRQYFDDDVSAMLFKCCLCYNDCSGRK